MFTDRANIIFREAIDTYHLLDDVNQTFDNHYDQKEDLIGHLLYRKCWIDTCLLYTSPSPRDQRGARMPSSA